MKGTVNIDYDYLEGFMKDTFVSYGVDPEDAEICASYSLPATSEESIRMVSDV